MLLRKLTVLGYVAMFCLRTWIPMLFFLLVIAVQQHNLIDSQLIRGRTNASPIYLILFITATYCLNRPCVYCSLLLAILVISIFDLKSDWFLQPGATEDSATTTDDLTCIQVYQPESTNLLLEAISKSTCTLANDDTEALNSGFDTRNTLLHYFSFDWLKKYFDRNHWRLQCMDVVFLL